MKFQIFIIFSINCLVFAHFPVKESDILCPSNEIFESESFKNMQTFIGHPWLNVLYTFMSRAENYSYVEYKSECDKLLSTSIVVQEKFKEENGHCFKSDLAQKEIFLIDHFVTIFRYFCSFGEEQKNGEENLMVYWKF